MTPKALATNIAYSLSIGEWTPEAVEHSLRRRLPPVLHRLVPGFAARVLEAKPQRYAPPTGHIAELLGHVPEFAAIQRYCQRHNAWPQPDESPPRMLPLPAFQDLDLPELTTVGMLADWLMLDPVELDNFADPQGRFEEHGDAAVNHYRYVLHKKSRGGTRVIEAPKPRLKALQRTILRGIVEKVPDHGNAFGFVSGRNCLQGAARHAGEPVVICFDLRDFFPSVPTGRVFAFFRCLGYPTEVARRLTSLSVTRTPSWLLERLPFGVRQSYAKPHLPQGSPVSPALANKVAFSLDARLSGLARRLDANYSRYADDLAFSGDKDVAPAILRAVPEIVRDEGFAVHPDKTRIMSHTSRQMVTGLVVNEHLNVDRRTFDRLKAVIHACGHSSDLRWQDATFRARLLGQIGWVEQVNPARGEKLRRLLVDAVERRQ